MTTKAAYVLQGVVFLLVGGIVLFTRDERHVGEAVFTLIVVFAVSGTGFALALHQRARERTAPRRPSARRYSATGAASDASSGEIES
jgi:hypothetical protein